MPPFFLDSHTKDKLQLRSHVVISSQEAPSNRRHIIVGTGASLVTTLTFNYGLTPSIAWAEEKSNGKEEDDAGIVGAVKSLFDPNEQTKSGKVLPKAYLKSAREVLKTLRESLKEDPKDIAKFRRTADAAKESIREYLSNWRGQQNVVQEVFWTNYRKHRDLLMFLLDDYKRIYNFLTSLVGIICCVRESY
jgi:hypothetical protein